MPRAGQVEDLARRARAKQLEPEAIVRRPVVVTDADGNQSIAIRPMANPILGWDHRALDGIYAAQFLTALRRRLES
ncbi:MAG TPA: 2-oxo acid dehydrogenase subunit E2 [Baekduia sp.]|uniref:2-oxo acid dehydrogenase subunit E2 n=1 Tax=Baekduia sp. TaxID=2600305 RepID=UPI002D79ECA8|nr:2-oxo acid dehydrogenase subunit E2 [Baekduia sp.]HET6509674.1 2-oxo acid dehydrogenase subunit E2 [Baekduia sp.]